MSNKFERNLLRRLVAARCNPDEFSPPPDFYQSTGISPRKFKEMMEGMSPISGKEYAAIAKFLGMTKPEAMETRQLKIWQEEV